MATTTLAPTELTQNLYTVLDESRQVLKEWETSERAKVQKLLQEADTLVQSHTRQVQQSEAQLLSLRMEGSLKLNQSQPELEAVKQEQIDRNEQARRQLEHLQTALDFSRKAHQGDREIAQQNQQLQQTHQVMQQTTLDDLTRGMLNYKSLGLEFVKAEQDRLRFCFTQIHAAQPEAKCSFELGTTYDQTWMVYECDPHLDDAAMQEPLSFLNESNNMMEFIRGMRREFVRSMV